MLDLISSAIDYHRRSWTPIPLRGKSPALSKGWQRVRWETEEELVEAFKEREVTGVGVVLGLASDGLADIDLDCNEALILAPYFFGQFNTLTFGRKSRPNSHYLFHVTDKKDVRRVPYALKGVAGDEGMLVEKRGEGGQTMMPGSVHPDGEVVEWMSAEGATLVDITAGALDSRVRYLAAASLLLRYWERGMKDDLATAVAGAMVRAGNDATMIDRFIRIVSTAAGDKKVDDKMKAAELAEAFANKTGNVPGIPRLKELLGDHVTDALVRWLRLVEQAEQAEYINLESSRLTVEDVFAAAEVEVPQIVEGLLLKSVGVLIAEGGTGKSTLALWMAAHIALGTPVFGRHTMRGKTLILTAEDEKAMLMHRLGRMLQQMLQEKVINHGDVRDIIASIHIADISTQNARLMTKTFGVLSRTSLVDEVVTKFKGQGIVSVVVDPFSLVSTGEENSNSEVAEMMRTGAYIAHELDCAFTFIHHTGKGAGGGEKRDDQYAGRGASAFADNARCVVTMGRMGADKDGVFQRHASCNGVRFTMPDAIREDDIAAGNVLTLITQKMSYAAVTDRVLFLIRRGWAFDHHEGVVETSTHRQVAMDEDSRDRQIALLRLLRDNGGMSKARLEDSVAVLSAFAPTSIRRIRMDIETLRQTGYIDSVFEKRGAAKREAEYFVVTQQSSELLLQA